MDELERVGNLVIKLTEEKAEAIRDRNVAEATLQELQKQVVELLEDLEEGDRLKEVRRDFMSIDVSAIMNIDEDDDDHGMDDKENDNMEEDMDERQKLPQQVNVPCGSSFVTLANTCMAVYSVL